MSFHWKTDDESRWDEAPAPSPRGSTRRRAILPAVALALLLGLGAWAVLRQVESRVEQRRAEIVLDVTRTANLLHLAASRQDRELFMTMLSGRDLAWTEAQKTLVLDGNWLDRSALGLSLPEDAGFEIAGTQADAELLQVIVTGTVTYLASDEAAGQVPARLERQEVYRLGPDRWLYSPPDAAYWGAERVSAGRFLRVQYPARDEPIVTRLAFDLEELLGRVCATPEERIRSGCQDVAPFDLTLTTDASSLVRLLEPGDGRSPAAATLPTPTLVGLPLDEPAYEALLASYARQVIGRLIAELAGLPCCAGSAFQQVQIERMLYEEGLGAWPPLAGAAGVLLEDQTDLLAVVRRVNNLWAEPAAADETDLDAARLLLDFILERTPSQTPFELLLLTGRSAGFRPWLREALPDYPGIRADGPQGAWQRFLFDAAALAEGADLSDSPVPIPSALQLICSESDSQAIYRFDLDRRELSREVGQLRIEQALPAPSGDGLLIVVEGGELLLWDGNQMRQLFDDPATDGLYAIDLDPLERYLPLVKIQMRAAEPTTFALLPLEGCGEASDASRCTPLPLSGLPFWSPAGTRSVVLDLLGNASLADADAQPERVLQAQQASLFAAAWLDEDTVVLQHGPEGDLLPSLLALNVVDGTTRTVVEKDAVDALLPGEARLASNYIQFLAHFPAVPDRLIMATVSNWVDSWITLFSIDLEDGSAERIWAGEGSLNGFPAIMASPDQRWLAVPIRYTRQDGGEVELIDVVRGEARTFPVQVGQGGAIAAWSDDGRWLAMPDGFTVRLIAPDVGYAAVVAPGLVGCNFLRVID